MAIGWRANQGSGLPSGAATGDLAGTYPNPSVAALRGIPVSPTAPTIAGQSLRWNGAAWAPGIGVAEFSTSQRLTSLGTTAAPPGVLYLQHTTPALAGGLYFIGLSMLIGGSLINTNVRADLIIDGNNRLGPLNETSIAGGRFVFGSPLIESFTAGVHTIAINIALGGGAGTVTAQAAIIQVWRVQ